MKVLRLLIVVLATMAATGILFVNLYNSVVDVQNWGSDIPNSIQAARDYFHVANPGTFFRVISPANQLIALTALVFCWTSDRTVRYLLAAALILGVLGEVFTFQYFYPRNGVMFVAPINGNIEEVRAAWNQWSNMNWLRSAIIGVAMIFDFAALIRLAGLGRK